MWENLTKILTSGNAWFILITVFVMVVIILIVGAICIRSGLISINKGGVRIGSDEKELTIVRNQTQWAYLFVMSLKGKLVEQEDPNEEYKPNWFLEAVLERVFDKVVEWITYNHVNEKKSYIEIKQSEIKCLVYSLPIQSEFKTPEFECRMNSWVEEVILNLVAIRKEYSK